MMLLAQKGNHDWFKAFTGKPYGTSKKKLQGKRY
jgi:hypothetical protein